MTYEEEDKLERIGKAILDAPSDQRDSLVSKFRLEYPEFEFIIDPPYGEKLMCDGKHIFIILSTIITTQKEFQVTLITRKEKQTL